MALKGLLERVDIHADADLREETLKAVTFWLSGIGALLVISLTGIFFYGTQISKFPIFIKCLIVCYFFLLCVNLFAVACTKIMIFVSHNEAGKFLAVDRLYSVEEFLEYWAANAPSRDKINKAGALVAIIAGGLSILVLLFLVLIVALIVF